MANNIYTSANRAYLVPAVISLYSAAKSARAPLTCTLVTDADVSILDVENLKSGFAKINARLRFFDWTTIQTNIEPSISARFRYSSLSMAWMFVENIFDDEVLRAVYVDSDTLTLASLDDLFAIDLSGCTCAAVVAFGAFPKGAAASLNIDEQRRAFNSGVIVQDIPAFREEDIRRACVDYLNGDPHSIDNFADQDAFNVVCRSRIKELSPIYNTHPAYARVIQDVIDRNVRIIHFWGGRKPWKTNFYGIRLAYLDRYFELAHSLGLDDLINNAKTFRSPLRRSLVAAQSHAMALVKKRNIPSLRAYFTARRDELAG